MHSDVVINKSNILLPFNESILKKGVNVRSDEKLFGIAITLWSGSFCCVSRVVFESNNIIAFLN